jgi:hypothetical protein
MSLKILQLSDLHFCVDEIREALDRLAAASGPELLGELELGFANEEVLDALKRFVLAEDPEIVVVTGNITAFGDAASFQKASRWFQEISSRRNGESRPTLFVPGHHDALRHHLSVLAAHPSLHRFLPQGFELLDPDCKHKPGRLLEEYETFIRDVRSFHSDPFQVQLDGNRLSVCFFPFTALCSEPWWMSGGDSRMSHWEMLKEHLNDEDYRKPGTIRVVLTHHNPLCTPGSVDSQTSYTYRSMPGSMEFLRVIQQHGVDMVLHGHEQTSSICSHDFEVNTAGHVYTVASPSSSAQEGAGCNLLVIQDPNHVLLKAYVFERGKRTGKGQFKCDVKDDENTGTELSLERNRPPDRLTRNVRYEIKSYFYRNGLDESEAWKSLQQDTDTKLIYMSGRKLGEVRAARFELISALLSSHNGREDGPRIRMLFSNPELVEDLAGAIGGKLWGDTENLWQLAKEARQTLDELKFYLAGLPPAKLERVEVRLSHTLLPFGAFVTDPDKPWGKMAIKLLPVGAIGDLDPAVLRLNRRQDYTLFHFYLRYLKYLFLKGKPVLGAWSFGDGDLREEMGFMSEQAV